MNHKEIIARLEANATVFEALLTGLSPEQFLFKPAEDKWCILEVACHLFDEEWEDFRARLKHVLETPDKKLPPIDPTGWVKERNYILQNYDDKVVDFLNEREESVKWLKSLSSPKWKNAYVHPTFGPLSAEMFLANWAAHDYLHFRQITSLKYFHLMETSGQNLNYAGVW